MAESRIHCQDSAEFSVVIPLCNGGQYIQEALESVAGQTLRTWQCIIVDDGSDDDSYSIAVTWAEGQRGRASVIQHRDNRRRGVAECRNVGIRASSAPWIAFLDQDDIWKPSKLAEQADFIRHNPQVVVVGCFPEILFDGVEPISFIEDWAQIIYTIDESKAKNLELSDFVAGCPFCMSGVVARKATLLELGGFDCSLPRTSDWMMWASLASRATLGLVREALVTYRVHGGNELLKLYSEPLGLLRALLGIRARLADQLARDRALSHVEAERTIDALLRDTGASWARLTSSHYEFRSL